MKKLHLDAPLLEFKENVYVGMTNIYFYLNTLEGWGYKISN